MCYTVFMKLKHYSSKTNAKVNLSLVITGKRDNLHTLDMITYPLEHIYDEVIFLSKGKKGLRKVKVLYGYKGLKKHLYITNITPFLRKIFDYFKVSGDIYIKKDIPLGAGLGGSSATIVSTIKAIEEYLKDNDVAYTIDSDFLLSLGSDVPCMYMGGINRVQGVGDIVTPLTYDKNLNIDVAIAKGGSSTKDCYALYDELAKHQDIDSRPIPSTVDEALSINRNDLLEPAKILNPHIESTLIALENHTGKKVYMSGSGSALFTVDVL